MEKYFLVKATGKEHKALPIKIFKEPESLKIVSNRMSWKILKEMRNPSCPIDISKKLGIHEQKVYYYIRKFRDENLIEEVREEQRHGILAKFYKTKNYAFGLAMDVVPKEKEIKIPFTPHIKSLEPFIVEGEINSKIIVGSPDPHGPYKARASDSCCAIDFALFLGSFTNRVNAPNYKLDVEVREKDLKDNLILIGGPTVNMITRRINKHLPIFIDTKNDISIVSTISGKKYFEEENGLIEIVENPFSKKNKILILAGKRFPGTRASILAFISNIGEVMKGNKFNKNIIAKVVKGYDIDGDGIIDMAEFVE
jgi:DNA-binding transcriptional ArsR family regulator